MEKISDVFSNIKERASNPLFFSFILSWLLCNWRLTLLVLYGDNINVALTYLEWANIHYAWPIAIAILYTTGLPFIRLGISAVQTYAAKESAGLNLRLSGEGKVPISKYLVLREEYAERTRILEKTLKEESKTQEDYEKEHTKFLDEERKSNALSELNKSLKGQLEISQAFTKTVFNVKLIDGQWICTKTNPKTSESYKEEILIENGEGKLVDFGTTSPIFSIKHFHYNPEMKKVFFLKYTHPNVLLTEKRIIGTIPLISHHIDSSNVTVFINDLIMDGNSRLYGSEDSIHISYERMTPF